MDKRIRLILLATISSVAMLTSACTSFRGSSQGAYGSDEYGSGSSQMSRTGQVSGSSSQVDSSGRRGFFSQQRAPATCKPCGSTSTAPAQNTYTYKPAPKPKPKTVYKPPAPQAGQHSQQWYIDRWNRQQQQQRTQAKPVVRSNTSTTYTGYGNGGYDAGTSNTGTYYDYSSASGANTTAPSSTSTSNKSIYTGSYQQKTYQPYKPKTYTGGSSATTTYAGASTTGASGASGGTYIVKKGDTVFEIMRQTGVYWKDIIRINNLQPPYNISPGQVIRLK